MNDIKVIKVGDLEKFWSKYELDMFPQAIKELNPLNLSQIIEGMRREHIKMTEDDYFIGKFPLHPEKDIHNLKATGYNQALSDLLAKLGGFPC